MTNIWTRFMDMYSGGGNKEKWSIILIQAPENEAKTIFYNRFGHNPGRVSCTCCGEDYSISYGTLEEITAYDRGCRSIRKKGCNRYDPLPKGISWYLEPGENPPNGYEVDDIWSNNKKGGITVEEYLKKESVLVIYEEDIKPEERVGSIPEQGYTWID